MGVGGVAVRRATVADTDAVGRLHVDAWRWAYDGLVDAAELAALDPAARAAMWRRVVERGLSAVFVAERDGSLAGFASCGASRDDDTPDAGELYALYVEPAAYRTGVGAALMRAVLTELAARGHAGAVLWVLDGNARGRTFYQRWGWQPDGATKDEPNGDGPPLHELRYARPLP